MLLVTAPMAAMTRATATGHRTVSQKGVVRRHRNSAGRNHSSQ